jgi:hypothetical protein
MQKLTIDDIKDSRAYERERNEFRRHIIDLKKRRRVAVGPIVSLVFENTDTMRWQVQEMARAERMLRDEQIEHEVATYNELIPDAGELSATLLIELSSESQLREWLPKLVGIQRHIAIVVDGSELARSYEPDEERLTREEEITPAVHFVKFRVGADAAARIGEGEVHIVCDHPAYPQDVPLTADQRAELARDLT